METTGTNLTEKLDPNEQESSNMNQEDTVVHSEDQTGQISTQTTIRSRRAIQKPLAIKRSYRVRKSKRIMDENTSSDSTNQVNDELQFNIAQDEGDNDEGKPPAKKKKKQAPKKKKSRPIEERTRTPPLLKMPLEIVQQIGLYLPDIRDAFFLSSTCKDLQNMLGPKNKFFWFNWGTESAPQKAFKVYNSDFNYRKSLASMYSGRLSKKHCQVCLTTKDVKHHVGLDVKTCFRCFEINAIFLLDVMFIPNVDWSAVKQYKVALPDYRNSSGELTAYFDHFQCHVSPEDHFLYDEDDRFHCFRHSIGRTLIWEPWIKTKVEKANPGKSYDECMAIASFKAEEWRTKLMLRYSAEVELLMNLTLEYTRAGREAYATLAREMTQSEKETFFTNSKQTVRAAIRNRYEFYPNYKQYLDQKELPPMKKDEWLKLEAKKIARNFFARGNVWFFGQGYYG